MRNCCNVLGEMVEPSIDCQGRRASNSEDRTIYKISGIGPQGHTILNRNTASEALRKALELTGAGFGNVRLIELGGCMLRKRSNGFS
jgi:hypothetical protein